MGPSRENFVNGRVMDPSLSIGCPGHRQALPLHACVEYPQDKVEDAMIAEFALRSAPGRREVREDKCDELRLGKLNGNRPRSWAFCHIAHRKWVDVKPERSSPESLTIAYNTKGYGTPKTRNHLTQNAEHQVAHHFVRSPH